MVLPIDVRLGVFHIRRSDDDACLLDNAIKHYLKEFEHLVDHSIAMQQAVILEVFKRKPAIAVVIASIEKLHVLILCLIIVLLRLLPRWPPQGRRFSLSNTPEVASLGVAISVWVEKAEA